MVSPYLKAVHIIFIVTWFAGLFYMPRLLIYITESYARQEPERSILLRQLTPMASKLWFGITWPSAVITFGLGITMIITNPSLLSFSFMHLKLSLVVMLYLYHFSLQIILNKLKRGIVQYTSQQLRIWNEVATIFLIAIVFVIVLKNALDMLWGLIGLLIITILILGGIKLYKRLRK